MTHVTSECLALGRDSPIFLHFFHIFLSFFLSVFEIASKFKTPPGHHLTLQEIPSNLGKHKKKIAIISAYGHTKLKINFIYVVRRAPEHLKATWFSLRVCFERALLWQPTDL
jgi:hypothetical protein